MAWGDMCDPDREDSDELKFSIPLALPHSSARYQRKLCGAHEELRPAPEAYGAISFGCSLYDDDVLSTAASESEDLLPDTCGSLPPSGQERCLSPSYSELQGLIMFLRSLRNIFSSSRWSWKLSPHAVRECKPLSCEGTEDLC